MYRHNEKRYTRTEKNKSKDYVMDYAQTEEEQIAFLKQWWKSYGLLILWGILLVSALYLGWQYWSMQQARYQEQASQQFMDLVQAMDENNATDVESHVKVLKERYNRTVYSEMAVLMAARLAVDHKDYEAAKNHLRWIIAHKGSSYPYKSIAQIRLARLLIEEQAFEEAETVLEGIEPEQGYEPMIEELKKALITVKVVNV